MTESMTRAKIRLLTRLPFFASLAMRLNYVVDETIPTALVNGVEIKYNPSFFDPLSEEEQLGILAHEVMHPALLHHTRRGTRELLRWNKACDYAINPILTDSKIFLPKGALLDPKYKGMSAEEIYELLPPEPASNWAAGNGFPGGLGDVADYNGSDTPLEERRQQMGVVQAYGVAKRMGSVPEGLKRLIEEMLNPKVHWVVLLLRYLSEMNRSDYTWRKPNRTYMNQGIYAPSLLNQTHGEMVFSIDTSGSIIQEDLNDAAGELNGIAEIVQNTLYVTYTDAKLQHVDIFYPGDEIKMNAKGGGGTSFIPPFEYVESEGIEPKLLIYFTDGRCNRFPKEPIYDTLWLVKGNKSFNPPFGEIIHY